MTRTAQAPSIHFLADTLRGAASPLGEVIPFIPLARLIDMRGSYLHLQEYTDLPDFELHIGDNFLQYERCRYLSSKSERIRIVLRRDLIPSPAPGGCGTYQNVESREFHVPNRRQAKHLLTALLARVAGVTPWYSNQTLSSWKFPNVIPMESPE